jgi:hypothetical protein
MHYLNILVFFYIPPLYPEHTRLSVKVDRLDGNRQGCSNFAACRRPRRGLILHFPNAEILVGILFH